MLWVFSIMVALLAAIGLAGYSGFVLWRSFELTSLAQRSAARVEEIAVVLRANLWVDAQGVPRIALGDQVAGDRMRLPAWLVGDDRTPWGARYGYCPLAIGPSGGGVQSTVTSGPAYSYGVTTTAVYQPGIPGMAYVVGATPDFDVSGPTNRSVVGFIVSPAPYVDDAPNCESIVLRNGFFVIDSHSASAPGSVLPVTALGTILSSATQGLTSSKFDSLVYVAPAALGNASGSDPADAMTYADAYRFWQSVQPRVTTFDFAAGSYQVAPGQGEFRLDSPSRVVRFVGTGEVTIAASSATRFAFDGDASLTGVAFGAGTTVAAEPGARLLVRQGSVESLAVDGGSVDVDPSAGLGTVTLRGGVLRFASAATRLQSAPVGSGVIAGTSAGAAVGQPFGAIVASGGEIVVDGVSVPSSGGAMPMALSGTARVALLDGGSIAGVSTTESTPPPNCDSGDAYGRFTCIVACDPAHPFIRQGSCPVTGGVLAGFMRTQDPASGIESYQCVSRADQQVAQKNVLVPVASGSTQPAVGTAVDLAPSPSFVPSASGYCSVNP